MKMGIWRKREIQTPAALVSGMTSTCAHDSKGELSLLVYAQDGGLTSDLKEREVRSETADRNKSEAFHGKEEKRKVKEYGESRVIL